MIIELQEEFTGIGEVRGFEFKQMAHSGAAYIYKVQDGDTVHYEVFKRKSNPICINFEKREYSKTDKKESYPKSNAFGMWAWSVGSWDNALIRFNNL